jgi:hypothetical protein
MSFFHDGPFELPSPPAPPWAGPPRHQLPGVVPRVVPVADSGDTAVSVVWLAAYPSGVELLVEVRLRRGSEPGVDPRLSHGWTRDAATMVQFGVVLADGARAVGRPAGHAAPDGGQGGALLTVLPGPQAPGGGPSLPGVVRFGADPAWAAGGGDPAIYRMTLWLWPLPPPGPLTLVAAFPARGLAESRAVVDAAEVREAAERTVTLWPDNSVLPEAGQPPVDQDVAAAAVTAAYTQAFTGGQGPERALAAVEDGAALRETLRQARDNFPRATHTARVLVAEPVFTDPSHATVLFEIVYTGGARFGHQVGHAVLDGGTWKVARHTYCMVMSWAGASCPES